MSLRRIWAIRPDVRSGLTPILGVSARHCRSVMHCGTGFTNPVSIVLARAPTGRPARHGTRWDLLLPGLTAACLTAPPSRHALVRPAGSRTPSAQSRTPANPLSGVRLFRSAYQVLPQYRAQTLVVDDMCNCRLYTLDSRLAAARSAISVETVNVFRRVQNQRLVMIWIYRHADVIFLGTN